MKVTPTPLPEVLLIEPKAFPDSRGHFLETYQAPATRSSEGLPLLFKTTSLFP
jgi:dTDP-4-dehydrorhamnose 3,5-epimerase-like enzyme